MNLAYRRTKAAVYWSAILGEPLAIALFLLKPILSRDLHASDHQLALLTTLKHAITLVSVYGSMWALNKRERLKPQLIWTGIILRVPFFFFAWIYDAWWALLAVGVHMLVGKAANPAWFETMRLNLPKEERTRIYAASSAISCLEGLLLGWMAKGYMQAHPSSWRTLFPLSALVGVLSLWWVWRIPLPKADLKAERADLHQIKSTQQSALEFFSRPWKTAFKLLRERADFRTFQLGYFVCGGGILLFQALLPNFCVRELQITDYAVLVDLFAIYFSIGFAISMYSWNRSLQMGLFRASALICLFFALHISLLIAAHYCHGHHILQKDAPKFLLRAAQIVYGIAMGGSHVMWNMSGTLFCREGEDSSIYTTTNMVAIGVRAVTLPFLGAFLSRKIGYLNVLYISALCCFVGAWILNKRMQIGQNGSIDMAKN